MKTAFDIWPTALSVPARVIIASLVWFGFTPEEVNRKGRRQLVVGRTGREAKEGNEDRMERSMTNMERDQIEEGGKSKRGDEGQKGREIE